MSPRTAPESSVAASAREAPCAHSEARDATKTHAARSVTSIARLVLRRCAHWSPVIVGIVLVAQVAFLGLRPALSEARRLAAADSVLQARYAEDAVLNHALTLQLRARLDPVFRERQRRAATLVAAVAPHDG